VFRGLSRGGIAAVVALTFAAVICAAAAAAAVAAAGWGFCRGVFGHSGGVMCGLCSVAGVGLRSSRIRRRH